MVVLGVILVASSAVWPSGVNRASADIPTKEWADLSSLDYGDLQDVAYGNGVWIAVGSGGTILRSTDTENWTRIPNPESGTLYGVNYLNGTWFAVGDSSVIYTSTDGVTWQNRQSVIGGYSLYSISTGVDEQSNPVYVVAGEGTHTFTSSDGAIWTAGNVALADNYPLDVAYGNGRFLAASKTAGSGSATVSESTYGTTWTTITSPSNSVTGIVYGEDRFVAGSTYYGEVYYSPDGSSWSTSLLGSGKDTAVVDLSYNTEYQNLSVLVRDYNTNSISAYIGYADSNNEWLKEPILQSSNVAAYFRSIAVHDQNGVAVGDNGTLFARGIELSTDNTLSSLSVSGTQLNVPFSPTTLNYTATVESNVTEVEVTAATTSDKAKLSINGSPATSGQAFKVPLKGPGQETLVTIQVVPQSPSASSQSYTVTIKQKRDTELSSLVISEGTLYPVFEPQRYEYWTEAATQAQSISVTPTAINAGTNDIEIWINDSQPVKATSGTATTLNLREGSNHIQIKVTSTSSSQSVPTTYSIYLFREYSSYLNNLTVSEGTLTPEFKPLVNDYEVYVGNATQQIGITPTAASESASITVNGQPTVSGSVYTAPLAEGWNTFKVVVTNQGYYPKSTGDIQIMAPIPVNTETYTVSVYRAGKEPNPFLESLSISPGTLTPSFAPSQTNYSATVSNSVYNLDVSAIPFDDNVKVSIQGNLVKAGQTQTVPLGVGLNVINVVVQANSEISKTYTINVTRQSAPGTTNPDPGTTTPVTPTTPTPTTPTPTTPANGLEVLVNGQPTLVVATGGPAQVNGQTVFTATIDTARLTTFLNGTTGSPIVTIPVRTEADRVIAVLTGEAANLLSSRNATLRIESLLGNYTIPSSQIRLGTAANSLGVTAGSSNLNVNVVIEKSGTNVQNRLSQAAANGGFTAASAPIDFMITASAGDRTVELNSFTEYVEREIPLPTGTNSNQITTAVVIEADGTVRHVPTAVTRTGTNDYARVNSLTNSSYALIWNPKQFSDVAGKWSQASVNDMASRLVVNGIGNDRYNPEGAVTRAEFAAILVRALGLPTTAQTTGFSDVASTEWYAGAASTANAYGLITGYPNGTFRPNATITRQEAFAILDRATQIVPLQPADASSELSSYRDRAEVASWARTSTQAILASGLVQGSGGWLRPEATLSRAESAAVAQRLLQQGGLID